MDREYCMDGRGIMNARVKEDEKMGGKKGRTTDKYFYKSFHPSIHPEVYESDKSQERIVVI